MPFSCPAFQDQMARFADGLDLIKGDLEQSIRSGDPQAPARIKNRLASLAKEREEFFQREYVPAVETLLKRWNQKKLSSDDFSHLLKITQTGRIHLRSFITGFWIDWGASYFPHLIQRADGRLGIARSSFEAMDYLEETGSLAVDEGSELKSLKCLKKIEHGLTLGRSRRVPSFPQLREIGGPLIIETWATIESFRALFPQLKKIGAPAHFISFRSGQPVSIKLAGYHRHLQDEIMQLQQAKEIEIEGLIVVDD